MSNYYYIGLGDGSIVEAKKSKKSKTKFNYSLESMNTCHLDKVIGLSFLNTK